jgi:hypothetical protein
MKLRLKDKELQQKLDEISDGDFSVQLQKKEKLFLHSLSGPGVKFGGLARVDDDRFRHLAPRFIFRFHPDEVEEVPDITSEEPKAQILWDIKTLHRSLHRIEKSLADNEPEAVDVRLAFAKMYFESLTKKIEEYVKEEAK